MQMTKADDFEDGQTTMADDNATHRVPTGCNTRGAIVPATVLSLGENAIDLIGPQDMVTVGGSRFSEKGTRGVQIPKNHHTSSVLVVSCQAANQRPAVTTARPICNVDTSWSNRSADELYPAQWPSAG